MKIEFVVIKVPPKTTTTTKKLLLHPPAARDAGIKKAPSCSQETTAEGEKHSYKKGVNRAH